MSGPPIQITQLPVFTGLVASNDAIPIWHAAQSAVFQASGLQLSITGDGAVARFGVSTFGNTAGQTGTVSNQLVLAGGSNITLSQATDSIGGATVTIVGPASVAQSNQTEGFYAGGNTTGQSSSSTLDARSLSFEGAGIVSVGLSAGSVVISATQSVQTVAVGSFGVSNLGNTAGNTGTVTNQLVLAGGNNITLSQDTAVGGITVTVSAPNQTNQTEGWYAIGNTTAQSSSSTLDARSISFKGTGGVSVGLSNGSIVISGATGGGGAAFSGGVSNIGNTAGSTGTVSNQLVLAGGNNITLSQSTDAAGATVTVSAPSQTNQTVGLYGVGNTTQNSSTTLDARSLTFNGLGALTVGFSNGSVQISAPIQSNENLTYLLGGNTVGTSSGTGSSILLAGGNNVTLSGDGTQITVVAAGAAAGVFAAGVSTGGNTAGNTGVVQTQIVFVGSNNITLSQDTAILGHGTITILGPSTVAQTNQTVGLYGVGNTTQNSSTTLDARTLSFDGLGGISVGFSNGSVQISGAQTVAQSNERLTVALAGNTAGTSTATGSTILLAGGNNITLSGDGTQVTIVGPNTAAQTNQSVGFYAVGNTASTSTSTTLDARTVSFNGGGIVSVGFSNGSINISATAAQTNQTVGFYAVGNTASTSTSTTLDARTISFDGAGIVSIGMSAGSVIVSATQSNQTEGYYVVGNTTNTTSLTLDARTLSIQGAGGVSVGFSNGSMQISGPNTAMMSHFVPFMELAIAGQMFSNGTIWVNPVTIAQDLSFCRAHRQFSFIEAGNSWWSNTAVARSLTQQWTYFVGFYTQQAGTNSSVLSLLASSSASLGYFQTSSESSAANYTISATDAVAAVTSVDTGGGVTYSTISSSSSTSFNNATTLINGPGSAFTGPINMVMGFGTSLSRGGYFLGEMLLSAATSSGTGSAGLGGATLSSRFQTGGWQTAKFFGNAASNSTLPVIPGAGPLSASSNVLPNSMAVGDIRQVGSMSLPYVAFMNSSM